MNMTGRDITGQEERSTTAGRSPAKSDRALLQQLKHFRRVATRYDKTARNFLAAVLLAATRLWMRFESTT